MSATTLTFGHQLPTRGDKGDEVFDALETNIALDDAHAHNGVNSARVVSSNLTRGSTVAVTNTGWTAVVSGPYTGFYSKTVTFPSGFTLANGSQYRKANIRFYLDGIFSGIPDQSEIFPKYERLSDTTITMYSPVATQAYHAEFL